MNHTCQRLVDAALPEDGMREPTPLQLQNSPKQLSSIMTNCCHHSTVSPNPPCTWLSPAVSTLWSDALVLPGQPPWILFLGLDTTTWKGFGPFLKPGSRAGPIGHWPLPDPCWEIEDPSSFDLLPFLKITTPWFQDISRILESLPFFVLLGFLTHSYLGWAWISR
jgi:hypothetical protein